MKKFCLCLCCLLNGRISVDLFALFTSIIFSKSSQDSNIVASLWVSSAWPLLYFSFFVSFALFCVVSSKLNPSWLWFIYLFVGLRYRWSRRDGRHLYVLDQSSFIQPMQWVSDLVDFADFPSIYSPVWQEVVGIAMQLLHFHCEAIFSSVIRHQHSLMREALFAKLPILVW